MEISEQPTTVAIIGSFKQHYEQILSSWRSFREAGLEITSPKGSQIIKEGIDFVRFESDPIHWDDPTVQTVALHRILRSDFVYAVTPKGYIGRTTCYEVGRVIQARRPIYFSEMPLDLPVLIPPDHILSTAFVCNRIREQNFHPTEIYASNSSMLLQLECDLLTGRYRDEHDLRDES